ncbi:hypothetical protein E2C01_058651 [Portunus trituberculatus]|uniref:Uncharacterized protein n=1 Tax=Portunus trituberculatus TaxID=210409 RepID=A0A5B7H3A2_PORTR|nr:hypothetical protein [Portunus trituberculatus]
MGASHASSHAQTPRISGGQPPQRLQLASDTTTACNATHLPEPRPSAAYAATAAVPADLIWWTTGVWVGMVSLKAEHTTVIFFLGKVNV